jgi:hypothetical protein
LTVARPVKIFEEIFWQLLTCQKSYFDRSKRCQILVLTGQKGVEKCKFNFWQVESCQNLILAGWKLSKLYFWQVHTCQNFILTGRIAVKKYFRPVKTCVLTGLASPENWEKLPKFTYFSVEIGSFSFKNLHIQKLYKYILHTKTNYS